jgi:hypothetical protein
LPNDVKGQPVDPNNPDGSKLRGRFSTIGYQANARKTWSATTTIESVAENFLIQIKTDRPEGSTRPMYFACHSLGGLVLCQALIQALHDDGSHLGRQAEYRHIFYQNDECLVKGIFFFGTPFSGSNLAKYASLLVRAMNGNNTLINSLRDHAEGLSAILGRFNQLRYQPATKIPIHIAYEKKPMFGVKFVSSTHLGSLCSTSGPSQYGHGQLTFSHRLLSPTRPWPPGRSVACLPWVSMVTIAP